MKSYVDVIVGGQAGSEGKGAITAHLARKNNYTGAIRCGGSNAGHTAYDEHNNEYIFQVLPVPSIVDPDINLYVGAESFFSIDELMKEIKILRDIHNEEQESRIYIDPKAGIITDEHRKTESRKKLGEDIGSTTHGVGAARVDKIWRSAGDIQLAEDYNEISDLCSNKRVNNRITNEKLAILEGTQGTLLSMNQSDYYPNTTSRDCIASSFLSSAGLPPSATRDVWCVYRTYPIRVSGESGSMDGQEISFDNIKQRSGCEKDISEYTSVTGRKRRIFEWSDRQFKISQRLNKPDKIAITFADYLNSENYGVSDYEELCNESRSFISKIENASDSSVSVIKTGPLPSHVVNLN